MEKNLINTNLTSLLNKYYHWRYWNHLLTSMKKKSNKKANPFMNTFNNKPGIILSFDDSFRIEHWYKYGKDILGYYQIKATFNVNAFHHFESQREHSQAEIDMLLELQANGHEIAHHGFKHKRATKYSNEHGIERWLQDDIINLFDWMKKQSHSVTKEKFKTPVSYAFPNFLFDEGHINELVPSFFKIVRGHYQENNLIENNHTGFAPSICIDLHLLKKKRIIKKVLRLAKKLEKNIILTCHSILPEDFVWEDLNWGEESTSASNWRITPETLQMIICEANVLDMPFYTTAELAGVATFIDNNFETCVRGKLKDPWIKWIPLDELNVIQHLDISNQNISNLDGIEYFSNLISLNVANNPITDYRLLKKLPKLKNLKTNKLS